MLISMWVGEKLAKCRDKVPDVPSPNNRLFGRPFSLPARPLPRGPQMAPGDGELHRLDDLPIKRHAALVIDENLHGRGPMNELYI